jgi:hypothetical protein
MRQVDETSEQAERYYRKMMEKVVRRMVYKDMSVFICRDDDDKKRRLVKLTPSKQLREDIFGKAFASC